MRPLYLEAKLPVERDAYVVSKREKNRTGLPCFSNEGWCRAVRIGESQMTDPNRERGPSFINVSQVSAMKDLWHSFRKEIANIGKDEVEVGLFLSYANKETLRFQKYLLRLGLDVNDMRNP